MTYTARIPRAAPISHRPGLSFVEGFNDSRGTRARHRMTLIGIDTGGTFTDCLALDPRGRLHRAKVLSSSALRFRAAALSGRRLHYRSRRPLPDGFAAALPADARAAEARADRIGDGAS